MIYLLQYIFSLLSQQGKQVYHEVAPEKDPVTQSPPKFPYIVFRLGTSVNEESDREDFPLIINIWDKNPDTTALEILTDAIDKSLKKIRYLDENQQLTFVKENRSPLSDPDPTIRGRQIRYIIKRYER